MSWRQQLIVLSRPLPRNAKSTGQQILPLNLSNQWFGRRGHLGGAAGGARAASPSPAQTAEFRGSGHCREDL